MKNRNTNQKKLILDSLSTSNHHPTIEEIYGMIREKDNTIGIATVYRNVKKYVQKGIIQSIKTKDGTTRYDYWSGHAHFECLNCKKIVDIYNNKIFELLEKEMKQKDWEIQNYEILMSGYCEECKKKEKEKERMKPIEK